MAARPRVFAEAMGDILLMQLIRERHGDARVREVVDPALAR